MSEDQSPIAEVITRAIRDVRKQHWQIVKRPSGWFLTTPAGNHGPFDGDKVAATADRLTAAAIITALEAAGIVLAPVEATIEMENAAKQDMMMANPRVAYRAMVAARPR